MRCIRIALPVFLLALNAPVFLPAQARAQDAGAALEQAVQRFNSGDYLGAQELLAQVNRSQLNPQQQSRRDEYVNRVQTAITMLERARRDLEDATRAMQDGNSAKAGELLDMVLANEYATPQVRESAASLRRELPPAPATVKPVEKAAPAPAANVEIKAVPVEPAPAQVQPVAASAQPAVAPVEIQAVAVNSQPEPQRAPEPEPQPERHMEVVTPVATVDAQAQPASTPTPAPNPAPAPAAMPVKTITPEDVQRAAKLTAEGNVKISESAYEDARQLFEGALDAVPGYPEAIDGLRLVRAHQENESGEALGSLILRIERENLINWQRTVAEYRDAEGLIRKSIAEDRYEEARTMLVRANQIVESGKQFASPLSNYESLRRELDALSALVDESERTYNEQKVAEVRSQIEEQRRERIRQDEENRRIQREKLMEQACRHQEEGDLDAAIVVLNQIIVIDPTYKPARWKLDDLEELRANKLGRSLRDEFYKQSRDSLNAVEEAKIPWADLLRYPRNWPEIIARPERGGPGMVRTSSFVAALDSTVPVNFRKEPLETAIEKLAMAQNLNIIVKWHDLQRVGVSPETPISLRVPNEITLKRALTEVLDQAAAGGATIGYEITDEALVIATQDTLDRNTHQVVYDINDLLMEVPNFNDAPMPDLAVATRKNAAPLKEQPARLWADDDQDDSDLPPQDPDRQRRVDEIIDLIQDNVDPESWRDRGGVVGHISEINGQLVITQNSSAQAAIGDLLGKLREQRAIQIAVEARFITVSSHYLEELGMDLDIILNSGNAGFDYIPGAAGPVTDPVLGNTLLLPRTFSRLGFTPATPALGVPNTTTGSVQQPYNNPFLVPQANGGSGSQMTPVPIINRISQFTDPANLGSDIPGSFAGQSLPPALSIFGSFLDNIQVDFLIRATQADSRTTVLTAPQLVLFNGQRSWVAVTIQQNFVSQLNPVVATGAVAQAPVTGTIDSGAVLDVNATVTADKRYVTMTLRPGVTRLLDLQTIPFSGGGAGGGFGGGTALNAFIQLPTLSSQRVQTTVSVPDGGTLLIGGQKLASETEVEAGVPILSKIPILKRAYNSRSMVKDEQTLLILIKPKILIQSEQEEEAFPTFAAPP